MKQVKKTVIRFVCSLLAIVLAFAFTGCGEKKVGTGSENTETVLTIAGHKVTYDEYKYFYLNYKKDSPQLSDEQLRKQSVETIRSNYALIKMAEDNNIKLTSDEKKDINNTVTQAIEQYGGEDAYYKALKENYLTGDVFRQLIKYRLLEDKLRDFLTDEFTGNILSDDATVEADIKKNFMCAKQILIINDQDDNIDENYSLICDINERIQSGEDFDTLMEEYSEDDTMDPKNGYYFTYGQMLEAFEDTVLNLQVDHVSGVVQSPVGFHIIKRLPLDEEYIDENFETMRYYFKSRRFNEDRAELAENLDVKYAENYDTLTFE